MRKEVHFSKLTSENALHQSVIAIVLMSVVPLLSISYIGVVIWLHPEISSTWVWILILASIVAMDISGLLIMIKYPKNIMRLRGYISEVAQGVLPSKIHLLEIKNSDDLMYIENGLNAVLREMRQQVELAQKHLRIEQELRGTIEQQQQTLVYAEKHRAMIQTLGAACHHLGQPVAILRMRLKLVKKMGNVSEQERVQIEECEKEISMIIAILDRLRTISEFRTEPYTDNDYNDTEILAI